MLHIDAFVYSYFSVMMHSSEDSLHWPSVFSFDYFIEWEGGQNLKKNYFSISHDVGNNGEIIIITINNLVMCVMII